MACARVSPPGADLRECPRVLRGPVLHRLDLVGVAEDEPAHLLFGPLLQVALDLGLRVFDRGFRVPDHFESHHFFRLEVGGEWPTPECRVVNLRDPSLEPGNLLLSRTGLVDVGLVRVDARVGQFHLGNSLQEIVRPVTVRLGRLLGLGGDDALDRRLLAPLECLRPLLGSRELGLRPVDHVLVRRRVAPGFQFFDSPCERLNSPLGSLHGCVEDAEAPDQLIDGDAHHADNGADLHQVVQDGPDAHRLDVLEVVDDVADLEELVGAIRPAALRLRAARLRVLRRSGG
jgi:hypothetical protein